MTYFELLWDMDDDVNGNVVHLAEHGISKDEFSEAFSNLSHEELSQSTGQPLGFGATHSGRILVLIWEEIDEMTIYPITAYDAE